MGHRGADAQVGGQHYALCRLNVCLLAVGQPVSHLQDL